jgi:ubiquitin-conjugating enzyme E2 J2
MQREKILQKQLLHFSKQPPECANAIHYDNINSVYIRLLGSKNTPFEGGEYILKLELNKDWPFYPPNFSMLTPSGRFEIGKDICTSFSKYHPQGWSPALNFNVIAISMHSFMNDRDSDHVGAVKPQCHDGLIKTFADQSKEFNKKHFGTLFQ